MVPRWWRIRATRTARAQTAYATDENRVWLDHAESRSSGSGFRIGWIETLKGLKRHLLAFAKSKVTLKAFRRGLEKQHTPLPGFEELILSDAQIQAELLSNLGGRYAPSAIGNLTQNFPWHDPDDFDSTSFELSIGYVSHTLTHRCYAALKERIVGIASENYVFQVLLSILSRIQKAQIELFQEIEQGFEAITWLPPPLEYRPTIQPNAPAL